MDIAKILEYQKLDTELFKIEKASRENPNRKQANEMHKRANDAQARSVQLEAKAKDLVERINTIQEQFEVQNKMLNQVLSKDIDKMEAKDVENLLTLKDKLLQNTSFLDKNLTKLAESVKMVIDEYQKASKVYTEARNKFNECKTAYDKAMAEVEPKKQDIENKLSAKAGEISKETLEKYKKLRQDNIFPVYVPLRNNSCGGCNMELPVAVISRLQENGALQCEHCHRIIYFQK